MNVYTHPVLRNDTDDIKGSCDIDVNYTKDGVLDIKPIVNNKEVEALIKLKQASLQVVLENKSCFYRKLINIELGTYTVKLDPLNEPSGRYIISLYIRSNKDGLIYNLKSFHKDYSNAEFILSKGSLLGYLGNFTFIYHKEFAAIQERDSIFQLDVRDDYEQGAFRVDYLNDSIIIQMHTNDHNKYFKTLNAIDKSVLVNVYIVPALIDALLEYQEEEYENSHWAVTLSEIIDSKGLNPEDPVFTAQRILADPVNEITKSLNQLTRAEIDDE